MSYLQSKGYILGCEGDLEGNAFCLACKAIAQEVPFIADLSQVNFEENYALMCIAVWHPRPCGTGNRI